MGIYKDLTVELYSLSEFLDSNESENLFCSCEYLEKDLYIELFHPGWNIVEKIGNNPSAYYLPVPKIDDEIMARNELTKIYKLLLAAKYGLSYDQIPL